MAKFLIIYGTRPESIKLDPLMRKMDEEGLNYEVAFTNQQKDLTDSCGSKYDMRDRIVSNYCNGRLNDLVSTITSFVDFILENNGFTHVIVQGDTASAYAGALAAFHRGIPVIHVEAGLRTYNKDPFPEEFYRRSISIMSALNFCPTIQNQENLLKERVPGKMYVVGNTGLDNLDNSDVSLGNEVLVTFHRRENKKIAVDYAESLSKIIVDNPTFSFSVIKHPNDINKTFVGALTFTLASILDWRSNNISFLNPLSYKEMVEKLKTCRLIISDSGGLQEESAFFKKRCIILRSSTERPEATYTHHALCDKPEDMSRHWRDLMKYDNLCELKCPFGNGKASEIIVKILKTL